MTPAHTFPARKPAPISSPAPFSLCVVGFPSKLGGADTELDHQISAWRTMGVQVDLIPTSRFDRNALAMKDSVVARGCTVHAPRDWTKTAGKHVISFCNGVFLEHVQAIAEQAASTTFVGCMTWPFSKEIRAHELGLIDLELFQTAHQEQLVAAAIEEVRPGFPRARFVPHWDASAFDFVDPGRRPRDSFRFGRISRADPLKFAKEQLRIYEDIDCGRPKEALVLGYGLRIARKLGPRPPFVRALPCGGISQQEFYRFASCVVQACDTTENLPRVGFEAMSSGSVLVVDDRGGWRELVRHGETGFLCRDPWEFAESASLLGRDARLFSQIATAARDHLDTTWSLDRSRASWEEVFSLMEQVSR